MPFESEKQRRYMWVHHPQIARRWQEEDEIGRKMSDGKRRHKKPRSAKRDEDNGA